MIVWGDDQRPNRTRPPRTNWDSPVALIAAVIWLLLVLVVGPRSLAIEDANERAHTAAHVAAIQAR